MKDRRQDQGFIRIYGKQPVSEALQGGWPVREVFLRAGADDAFTRELKRQAASLGVRVAVVEPQRFDRDYPRQSQGVAATVREVPLRDVDDVLGDIPHGQDPFYVAMDGIEDPHNLGAITRTALAMGVHAVVVPKHRTAAISEGAVKASAGAVFRQPICQVPNIHYFIEWAKERGMWVFGLEASAQATIWSADMAGPIALIIGGEGKGLARLTRERCDLLVRIPMSGQIGSLNASVACGMAIAEIQRRRQLKASVRP